VGPLILSLRIEVPSGPDYFDWRLPLAGLIFAVLPFLFGVFLHKDAAWLVYLLFVAAVVVVLAVVVFTALRKRKELFALSAMVALAVAIGVVALFMWHSPRDKLRWLLFSHSYKQEAFAYRPGSSGEFWHTYWDGWGAVGGSWEVFLVYDPNNSLRAASERRGPVNASGIPCEVPFVGRLSSQWYLVQFYMNETWGQCPPSTREENGTSGRATQ
jgi:energy-coupling factor transporter transmembrane protein EcfT